MRETRRAKVEGGRAVPPLAATLVALASLLLFVPQASAAKTTVNAIGAQGTGAAGALFNQPRGLAVNRTGSGAVPAGTLYVVDGNNNRIQRFGPAGQFVGAWGWDTVTNGSPTDLGGTTTFQICTVAADCKKGLAGVNPGQFGNNGAQGIAVDQARGLVYISDQVNRRISVFSPTGVFQGAFGFGVVNGAAALQFCTTVCATAASAGSDAGRFGAAIGGLAVDASGNVFVANKASRRVDVFRPIFAGAVVTGVEYLRGYGWGVDTGAEAFEVCTAASACNAPAEVGTGLGQFGANSPADVALDSAGNLFALDAGNNRVQKFSATPEPLVAAFGSAPLSAAFGTGSLYNLTVDQVNDHLYVVGSDSADASRIAVAEVDPAEAAVATHATDLAPTVAAGLALAPETIGGNIYVSSSNSGHRVYVLNNAPVIDPVTTFTGTTATFTGEVFSGGSEVEYHFEYSADGINWTKVPATDVNAGAGPGMIAVQQEVDGLIGSKLYQVRLAQTRAVGGGTAYSAVQTFTTAASAPVIVATFTSSVTSTSAVLEAEINPEQQLTTYHFEYGQADCASNPCASVPVPDAGIGSGETPVAVAKEITDLEPGTTYHFRVVAVNGTGTTKGDDHTFTTFIPTAPETACPNQPFRFGPGANLPDCRAYEMVSPVDKNGGDIRGLEGIVGTAASGFSRAEMNQASLSGDKMTYSSYQAFAGSESAAYSNQYISSRGGEGWSTEPISPAKSLVSAPHFNPQLLPDVQFKAFTDDLSQSWFTEISRFPLAPGGLEESLPNLYGRDNLDGSLHALTMGEPVNVKTDSYPTVSGHTPDGSHVLFAVSGGLTPDAAGNGNSELYDYFGGAPHLVSILPGGEADPDSSLAGAGATGSWHGGMQLEHAISDDGSRIFWHSTPDISPFNKTGTLYVRIDGTTTVQVSAGSEATFWRASADGSTAIYSEPVPSDALQELYEFDVDTQTRTPIAGEVRGVAGGSDDLSHLYFVSKEDLAPGAAAGEPNLYLEQEGTMTLIATLAGADTAEVAGIEQNDIAPNIVDWRPAMRSSRVSADGRHIAFMSTRSLTGYDNTDAVTGKADFEVYVYDADADDLTCVSCNPSGARPVGRPLERPYNVRHETDFGDGVEFWTAAWLPTWENSLHASRALSEDGNRVFFHGFDALAPQDTNGKQDVYQWSAPGTGTCKVGGPGYAEINNGCVSLISTGQSLADAEFVDATPSGNDVFIRTESSIDPRDPGLLDIYDARVGGGYPPPPASPTPCLGDACQSPPAAPGVTTPASAAFRGAGDPVVRKQRRKCRVGRRGRQGKARQKAKRTRAKRCKRARKGAGR